MGGYLSYELYKHLDVVRVDVLGCVGVKVHFAQKYVLFEGRSRKISNHV